MGAAALWTIGVQPALAVDLGQPYPKVILGEDIRTSLQEFSRDLKLLVVIDPEIEGDVEQPNRDLSAREFLNALTSSVGATWYLSSGVIYVDQTEAISQQIFDLSDVDRAELMKSLQEIGIESPQLPLSFSEEEIAFISGPPRFLETVTEVIKLEGGRLFTEVGNANAGDIETRNLPSVFRGRVGQ